VGYAATTTPGVIYYTENAGIGWTSTSLSAQEVYTLAFSQNDAHRVYAGTDNGVYVRDGGGAWTPLGFAGMKILALATHQDKPGVVFAGTEQGAQVSYNAGLVWSNALPELSEDTILSIAFDPVDPGYVYFGTQVSGIVKMYYR
jgi:ligand-binding sensor domain-containing protein